MRTIKKLLYTFKRIFKMDYKNMLATVKKIHKKTGRSRIYLFFDMIVCGFKYGAGYMDYMLCEFYNLNKAQRSTYVTRGVNNRLVSMLNNSEYYHYVDDKIEFNTVFSKFIVRDWLNLDTADLEAFKAFMEKHETIISKPARAACGTGIEKLNKSDFASVEEMFDYLKKSSANLIEECIVQHDDISAIYPHSVNTYRIVTVYTEGQSNLIYAFIRIGNGGKFVDNINAGGMAAPIDIETGIIQYSAFDKDSNYYDTHPMTGCKIAGYQLPYWKESVEMCIEAAKVIPQLGYVGWDISVTKNGPQLIEGNQFPGHDILQMPPHVPDKIGMLPRFRMFVKGI